MSNQYNELEQAIAEETRRAKWRNLWNQFGLYLTIVIAAILGGAAIYTWQTHRAHNAAVIYSAIYEEARTSLAKGNTGEAVQKLINIAKNGPINYKIMSQFLLIEYYRSTNNVLKTKETYQDIINNNKAERFYRELAQINFIRFKLDSENPSSKELTEFNQEISGFKNEHTKRIALEIKGYIQYIQKDFTAARATYVELAQMPEIDNEMRNRAQAMVRLIYMETQKNEQK